MVSQQASDALKDKLKSAADEVLIDLAVGILAMAEPGNQHLSGLCPYPTALVAAARQRLAAAAPQGAAPPPGPGGPPPPGAGGPGGPGGPPAPPGGDGPSGGQPLPASEHLPTVRQLLRCAAAVLIAVGCCLQCAPPCLPPATCRR